MTQPVLRRFLDALVAKDTPGLLDVLAPEVAFRGVTPNAVWAAESATAAVQDVLFRWFEPDDVIEEVQDVRVGRFIDRDRIDYRLRVRNAEGVFSVEQRAYADLDQDGRISRMSTICSGFRPVEDTASR